MNYDTLKFYMNDNLQYKLITASSIANAFMLSKEEFSKLDAKEFADVYLIAFLIARKQIEIRIQQEKEEKKQNSFFRRL